MAAEVGEELVKTLGDGLGQVPGKLDGMPEHLDEHSAGMRQGGEELLAVEARSFGASQEGGLQPTGSLGFCLVGAAGAGPGASGLGERMAGFSALS